MHPALDLIRDRTRGTSFDGNLFLVGGAVRDSLLGVSPKTDFDLVTTGDALKLAEDLAELSIHLPVVYARFGTARLTIAGAEIELVTARKESYDSESRKPNVEPATLLEDAQRRDFTINTLLQGLHSGEILDPLGTGRSDLELRILRTPLDPDITFHDDPLRMLRAVRFRWRLGFEFAPGLAAKTTANASRLAIVSYERIRDEVLKMLDHLSAPDAIGELMDLGILDQIAPELRPMVDLEQGKFHHLDVWRHSLLVLRNIGPGDRLLQLAGLLHDIGKPPTRRIDEDGNTRFFSHESVGAEMASALLERWKFSGSEVEVVTQLVRNHMRLGSSPQFSPSAARRLIRDLNDNLERLLVLVEADAGALKNGVRVIDLAAIRGQIAKVQELTPRETLRSPLSGEEIMELTWLSAGVEVGRLKSALMELVIEGELDPNDKTSAIHHLRTLHKQRKKAIKP